MINSELKHTDFSRYTFEEFLQNDFFISSVKYPTEEIQEFWDRFEKSTPSNIDDYFAAREYIETISTSEGDLLSNQELGDLWADIQTTNIKNDKIKHKNFFLIGLTAAASVAILVGSFFLLKNYQAILAPDIATFAVQTKTELPATEETLLILAEDKVVSLKEKETTITYDSVAIKANEENISKKELAVYNQLVIPRGKRSVLTFSDGSKVWVNAGTRVIYPTEFEKDKREIYVDGEIYIEVARDEERPFYVRTKDMNVRVLGTKFNVRSYTTEDRHVTLVQGKVQVTNTNSLSSVVLQPGQDLTYTETGEEKISRVNIATYTAWTEGMFYFEDSSLEEIMSSLGRWYNVNVDFERVELYNIRLNFWANRNAHLNEAVELLNKLEKVRVEYQDGTITIKHI